MLTLVSTDFPTNCLIRLPNSFVELYGLVNKVKGRDNTSIEDSDDSGSVETAICLLTGTVMRSGSPRRPYNRSVGFQYILYLLVFLILEPFSHCCTCRLDLQERARCTRDTRDQELASSSLSRNAQCSSCTTTSQPTLPACMLINMVKRIQVCGEDAPSF
jgi:hypothetical protein